MNKTISGLMMFIIQVSMLMGPLWGSQTGFALSGSNSPVNGYSRIDNLLPSGSVRINALRRHSQFWGYGLNSAGPLGEFNLGGRELKQSIYTLLNEQGLPSYVDLKASKDKVHSNGTREVSFSFNLGGVPFCNLAVKAYVVDGRLSMVSGRFPERDYAGIPSLDDWVDPQIVAEQAASTLLGIEEVEVSSQTRCLYDNHGELIAAWDLVAYFDGLPYQIIGGEYETFLAQKRFFDASGLVKGWEKNPLDGRLTNHAINLKDNQSRMLNDYFASQPAGVSGPATSPNYTFDFDTGTSEFIEATAFAFANKTLAWFEGFGYQWGGPKPLLLRVYIGSTTNNALYLPESSKIPYPQIEVGGGDGKALRNLPQDVDVVSHEFGHHVIFDYITSTVNESLSLHEGLSDFFAFQKTDDSCLGESICPSGSTSCYVVNECLRTADNDLIYKEKEYLVLQGDHLRGQLISGWLWDLHQSFSLSKEETTRTVMGALKFLNTNADFANLLDAMLQSSDERGGEYTCDIVRAAIARGLGGLLPDNFDLATCAEELTQLEIDAANEQAAATGSINNTPVEAAGDSSTKSSNDGWFCAVNPGVGGGYGKGLLILLFLIPMALPVSLRILG